MHNIAVPLHGRDAACGQDLEGAEGANLASLWQEAQTDVAHGRRTLVGKAVDCIAQIYGYLCEASLTYGFLTTYRTTWCEPCSISRPLGKVWVLSYIKPAL